jgi:hypothetical protein
MLKYRIPTEVQAAWETSHNELQQTRHRTRRQSLEEQQTELRWALARVLPQAEAKGAEQIGMSTYWQVPSSYRYRVDGDGWGAVVTKIGDVWEVQQIRADRYMGRHTPYGRGGSGVSARFYPGGYAQWRNAQAVELTQVE